MSRSVSIFSVVVVMTVTVLATVAVAFAVPGQGSNGQGKVAICHKPGTPAEKILYLPESALQGHMGHGDTELQNSDAELPNGDTELQNGDTELVSPEDACSVEALPEVEGAPPEEPSEGATPELTTEATTEATLPDDPISDTATLSGATDDATGTITFKLYSDAECTNEVDTGLQPVQVDGNGDYPSGDFTPTAPGTYYWIASYSGDASNTAVSGECGDANEQSVVDGEATSATATEQNVTLAGEIGDDTNTAVPATDTSSIEGTNQDDNTTLGTDSDDHLFGDSSANILLSRHGNDFVDGGQGPDRMVGGAQDDRINAADGKPGNDVINGGIGTDYCVGDVGDEFKNCDGNVFEVPVPPQSAAASN